MKHSLVGFLTFRHFANNQRELPERRNRIDMSVDLHTAVIVMIFAVLMIVSEIVIVPWTFLKNLENLL